MDSLCVEIKIVKDDNFKSSFKKVFNDKPSVEEVLGAVKSALLSNGYKRDEVYKKHH